MNIEQQLWLLEEKKRLKKQMEELTNNFQENISDFKKNYLYEAEHVPSFNSVYNFASFFGEKMAILEQPVISPIIKFAKEVDKTVLTSSVLQKKTVEKTFSKCIEKLYLSKKYVPKLSIFAKSGFTGSKESLGQIMKNELVFILEVINQYWQQFQIEFDYYFSQYFDSFVVREQKQINEQSLAISQIIFTNPILEASDQIIKNYMQYLEGYCFIGKWQQKKYTAAQLKYYKNLLFNNPKSKKRTDRTIRFYAFFLLIDFFHLIEYDEEISQSSEDIKSVIEHFISDFSFSKEETATVNLIFSAMKGNDKSWNKLNKIYANACTEKKTYLMLAERNLRFKHIKPFNIVVTATMSAGKSTFINAITGKNLSLSQNMACTSKIHSIISKAYNDGICYKYDSEFILTADESVLLYNNEKNETNKILISSYYDGILGGKRIIIHDSPGVNFSQDETHKKITCELIKKGEYDLLIYILNATQLGTDDDEEHLNFVKKHCGLAKIIFILNKVDTFNEEEEDIMDTIQKTKIYLKKRGFTNPVICPASSKAGYIAKKNNYKDLNRMEQREFDRFNDKFEIMDLPAYYQTKFPFIHIKKQDKEQLTINCGLSYIECFPIHKVGKTGENQ